MGRYFIGSVNFLGAVMEDMFPDPVLPEQAVWALQDANPVEYKRLCSLYREKGPAALRKEEHLDRCFVRALGTELKYRTTPAQAR